MEWSLRIGIRDRPMLDRHDLDLDTNADLIS